jgi:hypothetical protein
MFKSSATQISRKACSAPTRRILNKIDLQGMYVLHHGEGKAYADTSLMRENCLEVTAYDPYSKFEERRVLPDHAFDVVISNYVLNVLPPAERAAELEKILSLGNTCFITLRTDKVDGVPHLDGVVTSKGTFQSTKSAADWQQELGGKVFHSTPWYVTLIIQPTSERKSSAAH